MPGPYAYPRRLPAGEFHPKEVLTILEEHAGMELRDAAALAALQGLLASPLELTEVSDLVEDGHYRPMARALVAFRHADAFLKARSFRK